MWHPKGHTQEGFETHLGVNHLGHFYLTNLLLPDLKYSAPSRVVNLTCRNYLKAKINFEDLNSSQGYDPGKIKRLFKRNLTRTYLVTFKCE